MIRLPTIGDSNGSNNFSLNSLRFVICCASTNKKFNSIFDILTKLCNNVTSHIFYQSPYFTLDPYYLLSKGHSEDFLIKLTNIIYKNEYFLINENIFNDWMCLRFVSSFQFSVDTIYTLGGPINIEQLHKIFDFPIDIFHNKYSLQIVLISLIDYVALYEKIYPFNDKDKNGSVVLILYSAFELLKDSLIEKKIVFNFINDLFIVSPWIIRPFIFQGCEHELIYSIAHGATVLSTFYVTINDITKKNCKSSNVLYFILFLCSYMIDINSGMNNYYICRDVVKYLPNCLKVNDENVAMIVHSLMRIFKVFPDLYFFN